MSRFLALYCNHKCILGFKTLVTSSHLLLEHLDHVLVGAGATNLSEKLIELRLGHEDTNIVKSSTEVVFVNGAIFVDVHQLETVLVHLELLFREALILTPLK